MKDWLTTTDIAQQTGLKIDTIYTYRKRNTLPEPDHMIGNRPLWSPPCWWLISTAKTRPGHDDEISGH
jgi:hypothetical protein